MRPALLFVVSCMLVACGGVHQPPQPPELPIRADLSIEDIAASFAEATAEGPASEESCRDHAAQFDMVFRRDRDAVAKFNEGVVWQACDEPKQAMSAYGEALMARHPMLDAFNNRGVLEFGRGRYEAAASEFEHLLAQRPLDSRARRNLAAVHHTLYVQGKSEAAFEASERAWKIALAIDPKDTAAFAGLGRLYLERARAGDRSFVLLSELVTSQGLAVAISDDAHRAELHNLAGLLAMQRGHTSRALAEFETALSIDDGHVDASLNAALIDLRLRDFAGAQAKLAPVLDAARADRVLEATLAMGVARRGQRDYAAAEQAFAQARKLNEQDPRALFNLAVLHTDHIAANGDGDGVAETKRAEIYLEKFLEQAQGREGWAAAREDAKRRLDNAREYRATIQIHKEIAAEARELERLQREQEAQERERLLELERRAHEAQQEPQGSPTSPQ